MKVKYKCKCVFSFFKQVSTVGGEIKMKSGSGLPATGLSGVTQILITVSSDVIISDFYLHACNEPG